MAILITGASAGFGEAMCHAFTAAGFNVVGAARRMEKLQALAEELGGSFYPLQMDVADTSSVPAALQSLPEGFREIDCLINNAGLALGLDSADKADFADWQTMIQTNIVGLTFLTPPNPAADGRKKERLYHQVSVRIAGNLSLSRRQCLRRDQSLRAPIQPQPARGPRGHGHPRYRHRTGSVRRNRIFQCAFQGRRRACRRSI